MKTKKTELDVDFIGGQCPEFELTKEEQLAISKFIQARKQRQAKRLPSKRPLHATRKKVHT